MINGKEYSWNDIELVLFGRPVEGFIEISYTEKQEKTNIYGRGSKPIRRSRGRREYEASITLLQSEYEAIKSNARNQGYTSILDIPAFDVIVSYLPSDGIIVTDTLKHCEFLEVPKAIAEGDANMTITLPLIVGEII